MPNTTAAAASTDGTARNPIETRLHELAKRKTPECAAAHSHKKGGQRVGRVAVNAPERRAVPGERASRPRNSPAFHATVAAPVSLLLSREDFGKEAP